MSTNARDTDNSPISPWERARGESPTAYTAFCVYRDLAPLVRSHGHVRRRLKEAGQYSTIMQIRRWSDTWDWDARALAFDKANARERVERWERRCSAFHERSFQLSQKLHERIQQMLDYPLTVKATRTRNIHGQIVAITKIYPAKWNYGNIAALVQAVVQLESGSILAAMAHNDGFDPRTASPEECRAYLVQRGILPDEPAALPTPDPDLVIDVEPGPVPDDPVV